MPVFVVVVPLFARFFAAVARLTDLLRKLLAAFDEPRRRTAGSPEYGRAGVMRYRLRGTVTVASRTVALPLSSRDSYTIV